MGAFFLTRRADGNTPHGKQATLKKQFGDQGYNRAQEMSYGGYDLCLYAKRADRSAVVALHSDAGGGFCASTGTILYRETIGAGAVEHLFRDLTTDNVQWDRLYGHFCVFFGHNENLYCFNDRLAVYPIWHSRTGDIYSSSFLAIARATDRLTPNQQGIYEYIFQGSSYGTETVFNEIYRIPDCMVVALAGDAAAAPEIPPPRHVDTPTNFNQSVDANIARLRTYFSAITSAFGTNINTSLSGGYDSRLTLALLLDQGVTPDMHVYGHDTDADVVVAKRIADAEGMALRHTDKSARAIPGPEEFRDIIDRNLTLLDGTPVDGIIDNGTDMPTREALCSTGNLMLNGGGGEIFRNFFYLPDRSYTVQEILWSFYSQFDPGTCTEQFDEAAYHARLGDKIKKAAGIDGDRLTRRDVEMLYVNFRCRFWMGRNNGVDNSIGYALTPFIDANIVPDANAAPIAYKNYGLMEAAMIKALNPEIAAYVSAYGHGFDRPPPLKRKMLDFATYSVPPLLRKYRHRIKQRILGPDGGNASDLTGSDQLRTVLDIEFPYMRKYFRVERVKAPDRRNRLATLEILFENLGVAEP
jgi:asparagine synthase (glutamine-hydrolysing)